MERGSNKHSPRVDDQMAGEVRGIVQGTAGGRAEEWKTPEPSGEDQPEVTVVPDGGYGRGEINGVGSPQGEEFSRFGTFIGLVRAARRPGGAAQVGARPGSAGRRALAFRDAACGHDLPQPLRSLESKYGGVKPPRRETP